jgi:hypothetical protein
MYCSDKEENTGRLAVSGDPDLIEFDDYSTEASHQIYILKLMSHVCV